MFTPQEFYKIKSKSTFNENKADWRVPMFIVKNKKVALPSVNGKRAVEADKVNRELHFQNSVEDLKTLNASRDNSLNPTKEMDKIWYTKDNSIIPIKNFEKSIHKKNNSQLPSQMDTFDNPMDFSHRRKKYIRNIPLDETIEIPNVYARKQHNVKINLAPLNHKPNKL